MTSRPKHDPATGTHEQPKGKSALLDHPKDPDSLRIDKIKQDLPVAWDFGRDAHVTVQHDPG